MFYLVSICNLNWQFMILKNFSQRTLQVTRPNAECFVYFYTFTLYKRFLKICKNVIVVNSVLFWQGVQFFNKNNENFAKKISFEKFATYWREIFGKLRKSYICTVELIYIYSYICTVELAFLVNSKNICKISMLDQRMLFSNLILNFNLFLKDRNVNGLNVTFCL